MHQTTPGLHTFFWQVHAHPCFKSIVEILKTYQAKSSNRGSINSVQSPHHQQPADSKADVCQTTQSAYPAVTSDCTDMKDK